jgi:hypothetical protein|uniref:hypothetical protein n=1 Tax=Alloprevotella sp. TaxID=1872471 RepID=UPI003FEE71C8
MKIYTPPTCGRCVFYNCISNGCREPSSIHYKGTVSPFALACHAFLSIAQVFKPVKRKKWHKVKTMDDMETPGARFI